MGEQDFVQYWSAFNLFVHGNNPYDISATREIQCSLGLHCDDIFISWNPPWLFLIMGGILWLPFDVSVKTWIFFSIFLCAISAFLIADIFGRTFQSLLYAMIGVFLNLGFFVSLGQGQIGPLLLFGCSLLFHGLAKTKNTWQQAAGLIIMSVKPHLFIVLGVALIWEMRKENKYGLIVHTSVFFAIITLVILLFNPLSITGWINHFFGQYDNASAGIVPHDTYRTATIGSFIRLALYEETRRQINLVLILTPLVAIASLMIWLKFFGNLRWIEHFPILLIISMIFAPYGWACDQTALGLVQASALVLLLKSSPGLYRMSALGFVVIIQSIMILLPLYVNFSLEQFLWIPVILAIFWWFSSVGSRRFSTIPVKDDRY